MHRKFYFVFIAVQSFFSLCSCSTSNEVWVAGWKNSSDMTIVRAGGASVVHNDVIYMLGGVDGKNFLSSIESAKISKDGHLSSWKVISDLPEPRGFMSAVVHKNRIYVVGGANGEYGKKLLNSIVSAEIFENGRLSDWREEEQKMLLPRRCSKLIKNGNKLFALGGFAGSLLDNVEFSHFTPEGKLTPWKMNNEKLTMPRYVNSVSQVGDKVFVLGGHHPQKGVGLSEVEFVDLKSSPMKWQKTNPMEYGRYAFSSFSFKNNLFVAGGLSGSEYLKSIEKAVIKKNDPEINWGKSINLPLSMANFTTLVVKGHVYLLGGSARHQYLNQVWFSNIDTNGNLGYWGAEQDKKAIALNNDEQLDKQILVNAGKVMKNINTEGYTYLLVEDFQENKKGKNKGIQVWLAVPKMEIKNNTRIQYSEGVYMSNFFSKSLNRNFESIIFVGTVRVIE